MTKLAKQRIAFAAAAFLIFAITSVTITLAAHSREVRIADFHERVATDTQ